jgi:hypothetical protein
VYPFQTLEDLVHAVTNMLSIIAMRSQHLLGQTVPAHEAEEELQAIHDEARRAADLLRRIPELSRGPIEEPCEEP